MKTKLINKDIRSNYTNELLIERGLTEKELDYFLNVPNDSALQDPANFNNIEKALEMFKQMVELGTEDKVLTVVD